MKRTSAELKQNARSCLQGQYGLPMGAMLTINLIQSLILLPFNIILDVYSSVSDMVIYQIAALIISLLATILTAGLLRIHLKLARREQPVFSDLFFAFSNRPDRFILAGLFDYAVNIVCLLPGLLLIILHVLSPSPVLLALGILLLLAAFALVIFWDLNIALVIPLLTEHNDMGVLEAYRNSFALMSGNKGRRFYINLSFIGWGLLSILSCGLGALWLTPYELQTSIEFYRDVTGELDARYSNQDSNSPLLP